MRINILGVGFDNVTMDEALARGEELLCSEGAHYVVTPNPEIVETCRADAAANAAVNGADLVLPDGIGIVYGAKILHQPLRGRVPGIEFGTGMIERCAKLGKSVYLLGAKPGVAEQAAENLKNRFPGLVIAGTHDGYFKEDAPIAAEIKASGADMALVCLGAPKQELFMAKYGEATGCHLLMGLGGSMDILARAGVLLQAQSGVVLPPYQKSVPYRPYDEAAALPCPRFGGEAQMSGKLIVFEGTDGSGKATQSKLLFERLQREGVDCRKLNFPRYGEKSAALVELYLGGAFGTHPSDVNAYAASTFYSVDRYASYKQDWGKYYEAGGLLIADRYTTSNAVHQAGKLPDGEREKYLDWLFDFEYGLLGLPEPSLVFYLDVPTELTEKMMREREQATNTKADIHEQDEAYLRACRENAKKVAERCSWRRIDCSKDGAMRTVEDIHEEIYRRVMELLKA